MAATLYLLEFLLRVPEYRVIGPEADIGNVTGLRVRGYSPTSTALELRTILRDPNFRGMLIRQHTGELNEAGATDEVHVYSIVSFDMCCARERQYHVFDGLPRPFGAGYYPITSAGQGVEGLYRYLRNDAGMHLRQTYDNLGEVQNGEGLLIPDYLWESVANQYEGYLNGMRLSEVGQTSLGRLKNESDQSSG